MTEEEEINFYIFKERKVFGFKCVIIKRITKKSYPSVVVIIDAIAAGLRYYPCLWRTFFWSYKTINLGNGGSKTENDLWRVNDIIPPRSVRSVIIYCSTNNIGRRSSQEISFHIEAIAESFFKLHPNIQIIFIFIFL